MMADDLEAETLNKEIYTEVIPRLDGPAEPASSKQAPFKCDYCEYKNRSKDILKEHMKNHKNERTRSPPRRLCRSSPVRAIVNSFVSPPFCLALRLTVLLYNEPFKSDVRKNNYLPTK